MMSGFSNILKESVITPSVYCWQKEIEDLKFNLTNISSTSDDGAQKLKQDYLQKLNALEAQVICYLECVSAESSLNA